MAHDAGRGFFRKAYDSLVAARMKQAQSLCQRVAADAGRRDAQGSWLFACGIAPQGQRPLPVLNSRPERVFGGQRGRATHGAALSFSYAELHRFEPERRPAFAFQGPHMAEALGSVGGEHAVALVDQNPRQDKRSAGARWRRMEGASAISGRASILATMRSKGPGLAKAGCVKAGRGRGADAWRDAVLADVLDELPSLRPDRYRWRESPKAQALPARRQAPRCPFPDRARGRDARGARRVDHLHTAGRRSVMARAEGETRRRSRLQVADAAAGRSWVP